MADDCLDERTRAEDILLGSLGYGEDAKIISIEKTPDGFKGLARYSDGEECTFKSEFELDELDSWALQVLLRQKK